MKTVERAQKGYSLIEVLVAFVILSMALSVLFRIFSAGLNNVGIAANYADAVLLGETLLEATLGDAVLEPGELAGIESNGYQWTRTIVPLDLNMSEGGPTPNIAAYRVQVAVEWPAGTRQRRIDLESVRVEDLSTERGRR